MKHRYTGKGVPIASSFMKVVKIADDIRPMEPVEKILTSSAIDRRISEIQERMRRLAIDMNF